MRMASRSLSFKKLISCNIKKLFYSCCRQRERGFNACATYFPVDRRFRFCESRKILKYTNLTLHSNFLTHDIRAKAKMIYEVDNGCFIRVVESPNHSRKKIKVDLNINIISSSFSVKPLYIPINYISIYKYLMIFLFKL